MYEKMKAASPWITAGLLAFVLAAGIVGKAHAGDVTSGSNSDSNANSRSNSTAIGGGGGNASQGQDQGQSQGQQQRSSSAAIQGQDASNKNVINITSQSPEKTTATINTDTNIHGTQSIKSAPPLGLGNLSPTTPCSNTYQLGVSGMGFGVGAGGVVVDGDCTRREYARILWAVGAQEAAVGMLCQNEELRKVAPVMCKKAADDLGSGVYPNQDLPAYPSTKPVPPMPAPKVSEAAPVAPVAEVKPSNVPPTPAVAAVPPGRSDVGPRQGDIVMGNDGAKYKLVGHAWVKIINEKQPLVPAEKVKMIEARNTVEGRTIE